MLSETPVRLVLTEPWASSGRLVVVDEHGNRRAPLLAEPMAEQHPSFAPDGRWLVFSSTHGHQDGGASLWLAPAEVEAIPVRLTDGAQRDIDPVWSPEGAIVFASDRGDGGDFDLYRLPVAYRYGRVVVRGEPAAITSGTGHEFAPTVAAGRLAFQVVETGPLRSFVAERTADGAVVPLSDGPSDGSPAWSPDGRRLAYVTARVRRDGGRNLDVVVLDTGGEAGDAVMGSGIELEATDEGAPAWSVDGRWLFATSMVRDSEDEATMSSVVHIDTWQASPTVRMLRDQVGTIMRLGAAIAPHVLDAVALGRNPDYLPALANALAERAQQRAAAPPGVPARTDGATTP